MRLNFTTQLIGIVTAAILLWLVVMSFSYQSFVLEVPLEVQGLKPNLAISQSLTNIEATVRSQALTARRLRSPGTVRAVLGLGSVLSTGVHEIPVTITVGLDKAWVVDYHPQSLVLNIVPASRSTVRLTVETHGFPGNGYALGEINLAPETVSITGPAPLLNATDTAFIVVDVSGKRGSFMARSAPEVRDANGQKIANVAFDPPLVDVSIAITQGDNFKTIGLQPQFSGELPPGNWVKNVEFDTPALTLRGDSARLSDITSLLTTPINLSHHANDFTDKVAVIVPKGTSLVGPNLVSVRISVGLSSHNRRLVLLPSYTNITEGLSVTSLSPPTVTVILAGPPNQLESLNRANTLLDLDLRGKLSGVNVIDLSSQMFTTPDNVEVISFSPADLGITLTKTK